MSTFFGPLFPDAVSPQISVASTHASLNLEGIANSGVLDYVSLRARIEGPLGNLITIVFGNDALTSGGEIEEIGNNVTIQFMGNITTLNNLKSLFDASSLIEMIGIWDPSDVLADGDDEFGPISLSGGLGPSLTTCKFFGPLFPDNPDYTGLILATGPSVIGSAIFDIEAGLKVRWTFQTGIFQSHRALEKRSSNSTRPMQSWDGSIVLTESDVTSNYTQLQKFSHHGRPFLIGLPYEELMLSQDADSTILTVNSTSDADWIVPGQRLICVDLEGNRSIGVVQSLPSPTTLVVDSVITAKRGSKIMPGIAVLLNSQQEFTRFSNPDGLEIWNISARSVLPWFLSAARPAKIVLAGLIISGVLDNAVIVARNPGIEGNLLAVQFSDDALTSSGELDESTTPNLIRIKYLSGLTTIAQLEELINLGSSYIYLVGEWNDADTLGSSDEFIANLEEGEDESYAVMGSNSAPKFYTNVIIFDRYIQLEGSSGSYNLQTLSEIIDLGIFPFAEKSSYQPTWGRSIRIKRRLGAEFQWFKRFLGTVRGSWKSFWLPTWNEDLIPSGNAVNISSTISTIKINGLVGDFLFWITQRNMIQVIMQSGTIHHLLITGYTFDSDDIILETTADLGGGGTAPPSGQVNRISWMERCRLDSNDVEINFEASLFSVETVARVVVQ